MAKKASSRQRPARARRSKLKQPRPTPVIVAGLVHPDWKKGESSILDEPEQQRLARDLVFEVIRDECPKILDELAEIAESDDGDATVRDARLRAWSKRWNLTAPWMRERALGLAEEWRWQPDARQRRRITYSAEGPVNLAPLLLRVPRYEEYAEATRAAEGNPEMPWLEAVERGYDTYEKRALSGVRAILREQRKKLPRDAVPHELGRNIRWLVQRRLCRRSLREIAKGFVPADDVDSEQAKVSKNITRAATFLDWPGDEAETK